MQVIFQKSTYCTSLSTLELHVLTFSALVCQ